LGNWLQRCYLDLFTLMKHIWIGRWPRQTSVALMNWLGGHFFVYINNKFSWLEQYSILVVGVSQSKFHFQHLGLGAW
jgi:hypothetical protein